MDSLENKINDWIENEIKYQSDAYLQYLKMIEADDTFEWGEMIENYLQAPSETLRRKRGLLLTGPNGCGKHTAAYRAVTYLTDETKWASSLRLSEEPFECVCVSGRDFSFPDEERGNVYAYLNALLDAFEGKKLCLVVEYPEFSTQCEELLKRLGQFACMYYTVEALAPLFLIVITEDEAIIPQMLRERLNQCKMTLPDSAKRMRFLKQNGRFEDTLGLSSAKSDAFYEELVEATEGQTYAQLRDTIAGMEMRINCDLQDDLSELAQMGAHFSTEAVDTTKQRFYEKALDFMDSLPVLLEKMPAQVSVYERPHETVSASSVELALSNDESNSQDEHDKLMDESNNMTGMQLGFDMWGAERTEELYKLAEQRYLAKNNAN